MEKSSLTTARPAPNVFPTPPENHKPPMKVTPLRAAFIRALTIVLPVLSLIFLMYCLKPTWTYWKHGLQFPLEFDYGEAVMLNEVKLMTQGMKLYSPPPTGSFRAMNYGPVYFEMGALFQRIFSSFPGDYFALRLLSLLGVLFSATAFAYLIYGQTRSGLVALAAWILFQLTLITLLYGIVAKPDSFAMGLSHIGLALALSKRKGAVFVAGVFFALALFTKQTMIVAPIVAFLVLVWDDRARAIKLSLASIAAFLLLGAVFSIYYGTENLLSHYLFYNKADYDWRIGLLEAPISFFRFNQLQLIPVIGLFLLIPNRLFRVFLVVSILVHIPANGKAGANVHYLAEPSAAIYLWIALGIFAFQKFKGIKKGIVLLCTLVAVTSISPRYFKGVPSTEMISQNIQLQQWVRDRFSTKKPIVHSTFPGPFIRMGDAVSVPIDDPFLLNQHVIMNVRRDDPVNDALKRRDYDLVVLNFDANHLVGVDPSFFNRFTEAQVITLLQGYRLEKVFPGNTYSNGDFFLYTRK